MTKFRLSNNVSWATEFTTNQDDFNREFIAALKRCEGRQVNLQVWNETYKSWNSVGGFPWAVWYDGTGNAKTTAGCYETRGNGFDFLSVSPDVPLSDLVWAKAHNEPCSTKVPCLEMRPGQTPHQKQLQTQFSVLAHAARQNLNYNAKAVANLGRRYRKTALQHYPDTDWNRWEEYVRRTLDAATADTVVTAVRAAEIVKEEE